MFLSWILIFAWSFSCSGYQITLEQFKEIQNKPYQTDKSLLADFFKNASSLKTKKTSSHLNNISYQDLLWWQIFPTTGMRLEKPFWPLSYPFLPHAFALKDLAPSMGKGIAVALLDTGIAAYTFKHGETQYTKHPDLTVTTDTFDHSYNFLPEDPLAGIGDILTYTVRPVKTVHDSLNDALCLACDYRIQKKVNAFSNYLINYGKDTVLTSDKKQLSLTGKRFERMLIEQCLKLTPVSVKEITRTEHVFFELLPAIQLGSRFTGYGSLPNSFCSDHGTHIASMIGSNRPSEGLCGIAPHCSISMFKTLHAYGLSTDLRCSSDALSYVIQHKIPIVNISLKCNEQWDSLDPVMKDFEQKIEQIPFVCAAVGNDGKKIKNRISYPARCKGVHFSVGAFGYTYDEKTKNYSCRLFEGNQSEKEKGPRYVAPGVDVIGCSFFPKDGAPCYAIHTGTSYATGYMSGFLALLLGEFQKDLSKNQLIELCKNACLKLHTEKEWTENVLYGAIDIRTALFMGHVLVNIKKTVGNELFKKEYSTFLHAIKITLFDMVDQYGKTHNAPCAFKEGFMDYFNHIQKQKTAPDFMKEPYFISLSNAFEYIQKQVIKKCNVS